MADFTLTTGSPFDDVTGTEEDDLFSGGTLETQDRIDGAGGFDTLVAAAEQNGAQAPTIVSVEDVFVDTGGLLFDVSGISGAERIVADGASATFTGIDAEDLDVRFGARGPNVGQVVLDFADGGIGKTVAVDLEAIGANTTFRAPTSKENRAVREVDLVLTGDGTPPSEDGDVQVDLSAFGRLETLVLSGEATSIVQVDSKKIDLIDAAATTGGVTVNSDVGNGQRVLGGAGDDDFKTGNGGDVIEAGAGDDVVNAGGGDNDVALGAGDDTYEGEGGNDAVEGGAGADDIKAGGGNDVLSGGAGADTIDGEGGEDEIDGGAGDDVLDGGNNDDVIRDGDGNDTVTGGGGEDLIVAGAGDDRFDGGAGDDTFDFVANDDLGDDEVGIGNAFAVGGDTALLLVGGERYEVRTRDEWRALNEAQDARVVVDAGAQTVAVDVDNGGTVTFNLSDADFFGMA